MAMKDTNVSLSIPKMRAEIAELRAQADKLEELLELAISRAESETKSATEEPGRGRGRPRVTVPRQNLFGEPVPAYRDVGTKIAAIEYLRRKGSPAGATEIARALVEGGKKTSSKAFNRTVDNTLEKAAKKQNPAVEKIEGEWALKEWRR
jgi:hypothetical protein